MFKKTFGCGSLIAVFFVTILVIGLGGYFAYNNYISPYLNNADLQELYTIYRELSNEVNESTLVTNAPTTNDYETAKQNLTSSGITIFDENGNIDPNLLEETNFTPTSNIVLTDKELASLINEFIDNPQNLEKLGITEAQLGGLETQVLEVIIHEIDTSTVNLSFIVKLDMTQIKTHLGFFGFFIPDLLYVSSENTLQKIGNDYSLINGSLNINNLSEEMNTRMLEILVDALKETQENLTVENIQMGIGELILSGIEELGTSFQTNIEFSEGTITFVTNE